MRQIRYFCHNFSSFLPKFISRKFPAPLSTYIDDQCFSQNRAWNLWIIVAKGVLDWLGFFCFTQPVAQPVAQLVAHAADCKVQTPGKRALTVPFSLQPINSRNADASDQWTRRITGSTCFPAPVRCCPLFLMEVLVYSLLCSYTSSRAVLDVGCSHASRSRWSAASCPSVWWSRPSALQKRLNRSRLAWTRVTIYGRSDPSTDRSTLGALYAPDGRWLRTCQFSCPKTNRLAAIYSWID